MCVTAAVSRQRCRDGLESGPKLENPQVVWFAMASNPYQSYKTYELKMIDLENNEVESA